MQFDNVCKPPWLYIIQHATWNSSNWKISLRSPNSFIQYFHTYFSFIYSNYRKKRSRRKQFQNSIGHSELKNLSRVRRTLNLPCRRVSFRPFPFPFYPLTESWYSKYEVERRESYSSLKEWIASMTERERVWYGARKRERKNIVVSSCVPVTQSFVWFKTKEMRVHARVGICPRPAELRNCRVRRQRRR